MKTMGFIGTHDRSAIDSLDMTTLLQKLIGDNIAVQVVEIEGRWCEVDTEQDLDLYVARLASDQGEPWSHDWRW
jgi:NDP-sugar pyrophosphorylase family protein